MKKPIILIATILLFGLTACSNTTIKSDDKKNLNTLASPEPTVTTITQATLVPTTSSQIKSTMPSKNKKEIPSIVSKESISGLKYQLSEKEVISKIGTPDTKETAILYPTDGRLHQDWYYNSLGLILNMVNSDDKKTSTLFNVRISKPSQFKTIKNIGIGSTRKQVLEAYKGDLVKGENTDTNTSKEIIVGVNYAGLIFNFDVSDNVDNIMLGATGE